MSFFKVAGDWIVGEVLDPLGIAGPVRHAGKAISEKTTNALALKGVDPDVKEAAKELISAWNKENSDDTGATAYIFEGKRSEERQEQLVEEGRSQTMQSKHIDGLAVDVWFWDDDSKQPIAPDDVPAEWYEALGEIGEELGFTWGGHWTSFVDKPHFEA